MASTPEPRSVARVPGLNRREFLGASTVALTVSLLPALTGVASAQTSQALTRLGVRPRADWAQGLVATGELQQEDPQDVKFLLVHHTASGNRYDPEDVPGLIRSYYALHTGPDKNWPDVAYNFFVDRFGTIWGRAYRQPCRSGHSRCHRRQPGLCPVGLLHRRPPRTGAQRRSPDRDDRAAGRAC